MRYFVMINFLKIFFHPMKLIRTWGNTNQLLPTLAKTNLSQIGRDFSPPLFICKMGLLVLRITEGEGIIRKPS